MELLVKIVYQRLCRRKGTPVSIEQGVGWAPESVWTSWKIKKKKLFCTYLDSNRGPSSTKTGHYNNDAIPVPK